MRAMCSLSDMERLENNLISEQLRVVAKRDSGSENVGAKKVKHGREKFRSWRESCPEKEGESLEKKQDPAVAPQATTPNRERLHLLL